MYGRGIYFATDSSKSAQEIYTKGSKKLLLCDVFLGDTLDIRNKFQRETFLRDSKSSSNSGRSMESHEKGQLEKLRKDSIFAPRGTEVRNDEFIVFDVRQAVVRYIVHYGCGRPQLHRPLFQNPTGFTRYKYKISREVDRNDPYYTEASIALGHFYRTVSGEEVASIDIIQNTALERAFNNRKQAFSAARVNDAEILAYHGTASTNIDSILRNNLDPNITPVNGRAHGKGSYFSEFPGTSLRYARNGGGLILFRVLPGKEHDGYGTQPIPVDCHSKKVAGDRDGYGNMLIITDAAQFLPAYVLHMK